MSLSSVQEKTTLQTYSEKDMPPLWNLGHFYESVDSPLIDQDLKAIAETAKTFQSNYKGRIDAMSAKDLNAAIHTFEALCQDLHRIESYAFLVYATHQNDPKIAQFYQKIEEASNDITRDILFFTLEVNSLNDDAYGKKIDSVDLSPYRSWLQQQRRFKPHQLSEELESVFHDKSVTGRSAWNRLFDETMASLRFDVDGKSLTESETLNLMANPDRSVRKKAGHALAKTFGDNIGVFSLITNTLAKDKEIEDRWRGFSIPESSRHLSNMVDKEMIDALVEAVRLAYPKLSHRYYALKAKWMGLEALEFWDRSAPLPSAQEDTIPWSEAKDIVLQAFGNFIPEMADMAKRFFDEQWIDAAVYPGKSSGAFCHGVTSKVHPYILMNYHGKKRDVMTLAHELGHGIHDILAYPQGHLQFHPPLTLAETASVFGEMLTFQSLLERETNPRSRALLIASKVEDMLNTVVRQIAFFQFERMVHDQRRKGELKPSDIGQIWLKVQKESLGPVFRYPDEYQHFWAYIPHFIHTPFYVYAYAFGDCLVNSLYSAYQRQPNGFKEKYLELLRAGGSQDYEQILAPFGLNARDPAFWQGGLQMIEEMIQQLDGVDLSHKN